MASRANFSEMRIKRCRSNSSRFTFVRGSIRARVVQIALAWLFQKDVIPIVGTTNPDHIAEAVDALTIALSDDEMKRLEEPYLPKPVGGHS